MFIKFDINGKFENYSVANSLDEVRPDSTGYELLPIEFDIKDIRFLKKKNGQISIDETAKATAETKAKVEEKLVLLEKWFDNDYRESFEKHSRRIALGIKTPDNKDPSELLNALYIEAEKNAAEIRSLRKDILNEQEEVK